MIKELGSQDVPSFRSQRKKFYGSLEGSSSKFCFKCGNLTNLFKDVCDQCFSKLKVLSRRKYHG